MADRHPQSNTGAAPPSADKAFLDFCDAFFTGEAIAAPATRAGGGEADGFDATAFDQAELLEVHFADGSVFFTNPQEFAASHGGTAVTRAGAADDGRVRLPFKLNVGTVATATRGSSADEAGVAVDHYRIAHLTDRTPLDRLYDWGAKSAGVLDRWFGGSSDSNFATQRLAGRLCRVYENAQLHSAIGENDGVLLRWTDGDWVPAAGLALPDGLTDVLILLHGTASSTPGSFAGLWEGSKAGGVAADWQALAAERSRLILAFEHRTLTVSPLRNVLDLLDLLHQLGVPADVKVHGLSHARGGLVGDLLALALGKSDEVNARAAALRPVFERAYPADHPGRSEVAALFDGLQDRNGPRGWLPGTFVRVACPARGTLLADRRTDFFLSLLLRSVALACGGNGTPWFERLQRLVRSLVACRAEAKALPGLEAMIPGRPLTLALNTLPAEGWSLPGRLRVIAGDSRDLGVGGLVTLLGDVFFGLHDHDFVVHTHSMFGGFPRGNALSRRVADRSVTHFGYFKADSLTRASVFGALRGDDSGFESLAADEARTRGLWQALTAKYSRWTTDRWLQAIRAPGAGRKPILVVLPGIMGSELSYAGEGADHPVWLGATSIFNGSLADLALTSPRSLQATGVLALSYERLLERAQAQFHVVALPYDWRLPVPKAAEALIDLLNLLLPEAQRLDVPVHLLAHSMGGLISRLALWCDDFGLNKRRGDLTAKLTARGLRLVQCGTPNRGSYAPLQLLMQQHPLTKQLATAARGVTPKDLAAFGARYAGLLAMMPDEQDATFGDLFQPATWAAIVQADPTVTAPEPTTLAEAGHVRDWLRQTFDALKQNPQVFYVAGHDTTPLGLKTLGGSAGRAPLLRLGISMQGDGTVPWNSTLAPERTWYTDCAHGSLLDHSAAFDGYFELLLQGRTQKLSAQRPVSRAEVDTAASVYAPPAPASLAADPVAYVLGLDAGEASRRHQEPIRLRVVHGSLDYARHPLIVGHYLDDGVFGAVKRVDSKLQGQFSRALQFGLFSGAGGSALYLRSAGPDGQAPAYPGAILLGLGQIGELSPASLVDTVARGVLQFAFDHLHQDAWSRGAGPLELSLSTVLVGTSVRSLTVRDSLAGVLQGVWRASQALANDRTLPRPVRIAAVEVIEWHEALALDAAYALESLLKARDWRARFAWPMPVLEAREGGVRGYRPSGNDSAWQRLRVRCEALGALKFELIGERARVEETQNRADVFSLRDYVARACDRGAAGLASGLNDPLEFGRLLFNLLLPQALKGRLSNFEQTVLLLDDRAAALPWEMLTPPASRAAGEESARPLAVQAAMLRQRRVADFREVPLRPRPLGSSRHRVLVVGAPDTSGWRDDRQQALKAFATLPGAAAEGRLVTELFQNDTRRPWQVTPLLPVDGAAGEAAIGASYDQVFTAVLQSEPWRILHLAGHGMVDLWQRSEDDAGLPRNLRGTGMVLSNQQMLTAAFVEQMDTPPEFVFINCCYSGDTLIGLPEMAASLAIAFIKMGSRAVVAAGWQVNDEDGRRFAQTLYQRLLAGDAFGRAVLAARREAYDDGQAHSNTWGAYQCYGDPEWRLGMDDGAAHAADDGEAMARQLRSATSCKSPNELAERIAQVVAVAGDAPAESLARLLREALTRLTDDLAADPARCGWLKSSAVLARLGEAWRELGERRRALEAFAAAAQQAHSELTLNQGEFAANLVSRLGASDRAAGSDVTGASLDTLAGLDALEDTLGRAAMGGAPAASDVRATSAARAERDCLRGSTLSRLATDSATHKPGESGERSRRLLQAASHYARAWHDHAALASKASEQAYALSNALVLAGMAVAWNTELRKEVQDGQWLRQVLDDKGQATAPAHADAGLKLDDALKAVDGLLRELDGDENIDFWGYAGLMDLRLGRLMLLRVFDRADERSFTSDLQALPAMLEVALTRWPSPTQLDSLGKRPRQALTALKGMPDSPARPVRRRQSRSAPAPKALTAALQDLVDRLEALRGDQGG